MTEQQSQAMPLYGRVIITGKIKAETGLHIGGSASGIEIGGIDNIILRHPISQIPYIPGSSLKGKMRSLYERYSRVPINHPIDQDVHIHSSHTYEDPKDYSLVSHIFGMPSEGKLKASHPTPLIVRDAALAAINDQSIADLVEFTEVKWEAVIDRITSAAVPRQMERVPAGAIFAPMELIYNIYGPDNVVRKALPEVFVALQLVEDDYLGGSGSRGYGKVRFIDLKLTCKARKNGRYEASAPKDYPTLAKLITDLNAGQITRWINDQIPGEG